jgi:hypothetical protein
MSNPFQVVAFHCLCHRFRSAAHAVVLLLLVLATSTPVLRGSVTGSISGTVSDSSGAVIPNASASAFNTGTGLKQLTKTNAQGFYSFPSLPVGHYDISIQGQGFKEYVGRGLVVDVNSALRVDVTLEVGAVTQEVSVSATAMHVETTNTQMGEVISSSHITSMPLNGRSYIDLLALQPGVMPVSAGTYGTGWGNAVSGDLNAGNLSVSGQRESANGFMVNGGDVNELEEMGTTIIPNLDSIEEFRILTNNADAEYGNYSGGLVNAVTKSGTNKYHGSAFEFMRNPHLDARYYYSPERSVLHQNQFGGTMGGPIIRNKVFFFTDYQGTRYVHGVDTGPIPVPSPAEHNGDFADVPGQLTGTVVGPNWANILSQRLAYTVTAGEPYYTAACATTAQCVFPNAVIPKSAFSAPAKYLDQYIPLSIPGANFYATSAYKKTLRDDKGGARIDANTRYGMLSGYYFNDDDVLVNPYGSSFPGFATTSNGRAQMVNLGLTKAFGSSSVNELRLHYRRYVIFRGAPMGGAGVSMETQGLTGVFPMAPPAVESVTFNNFSIGASSNFNESFENTYQIMDNFSKVIGTHTVKFGGSFNAKQLYWKFSLFLNGAFGFSGLETGNDYADFLLGAPAWYMQGLQLPEYDRSRYYALYAQDSWRATRKLTLNYGLRWEVSTPYWEAHNQVETLVPGLQSRVFPGAPEGWVFPGDPGIPSTLAPTRYNNFAPRIGLAYSPDAKDGFWGKLVGGPGKTSIRAAFGIYFTHFEGMDAMSEVGDAPYGYWWSSPAPPSFATPFVDRASGLDRGQRFPVPVPPLNVGPGNPDNSINWSQFLPISSSPGFFPGNRLPYAEHYNLSIQRQFGSATIFSMSYVGTQGHRLLAGLEANPGNPALCMSVSQVSQVTDGVTCGPFGENGVYRPITGGVITTTRAPFSDAFGSNGWFATMANSNYSAFEATLRHTVGRLEILAGYTYSKTLDNASLSHEQINPINPNISKSLAAFDVTHNLVLSYSYRLPFDRLWCPNRLTNGWVLSGITRFATGFPVWLSENDDHSLLGTWSAGTGGAVDMPNYTPGTLGYLDPRTAVLPSSGTTGKNPYFNTGLFSQEPLGQLGTANRRFFHGPGMNNWDLSLAKELRLTESKTVQFRAEFYNAFNHAQFLNPSGDFLSSYFGFVSSARDARIGQVAIKFNF